MADFAFDTDSGPAPRRQKSSHGDGGIRLRQDGRYEARYTDSEGKRRTLMGRKGETKTALNKRLRAATNRRSQGLPALKAPARLTVAAFLDQWLKDVVLPGKDARTWESYESTVRLHLKPHVGKTALASLSPTDVQQLMTALREKSPNTARYARVVLRAALNQAVKWEMIPRNVAALAVPPKVERKEVRALTPAQGRAILDAVSGDRLETLFLLSLWTGGRISELLALRWSDVDLDGASIALHRQLQRVKGEFRFADTKTRRSRRTLPLAASTVEALRVHRVRQAEERLRAGPQWQPLDLVFCTPTGGPLHRTWATRHFQELLTRAELPHMDLHDLRHGAATILIAAGVPSRVVMEILGHSSLEMTLNVYAHVADDLKREAIQRLDAALRPAR